MKIASVAAILLTVSFCSIAETVNDTYRETVANYLRHSENLVLVHIDSEKILRKALPQKHELHFSCTVERVYRGDISIDKKLDCYLLMEQIPEKRAPLANTKRYLFIEDPKENPILIGTGDGWDYSSELSKELRKQLAEQSR